MNFPGQKLFSSFSKSSVMACKIGHTQCGITIILSIIKLFDIFEKRDLYFRKGLLNSDILINIEKTA
jgi:hypothetical protein